MKQITLPPKGEPKEKVLAALKSLKKNDIGMYTGGTPNMTAIGLALKVKEHILVLTNTADMIYSIHSDSAHAKKNNYSPGTRLYCQGISVKSEKKERPDVYKSKLSGCY